MTGNRPTGELAFAVTLHADSIAEVTARDLAHGDGDDLVSLRFGDDVSFFSLLGTRADVQRVLDEANTAMNALTIAGDG